MAMLFAPIFLRGQTNTISPYSAFGIGELHPLSTSRYVGMGHTGIGISDPFRINRINPASYSDLMVTTVDISATFQYLQLKEKETEALYPAGGIHQIAMAFPSRKGITFGLGLSPYSVVGYQVSKPFSLVEDTVIYTLERAGEGGLSNFFAVLAFRLKKLRIGTEFAYLFGTFKENFRVYEGNNTHLAGEEIFHRVTGFHLRIGGVWVDTLEKRYAYQVGMLYEIPTLVQDQTLARIYGQANPSPTSQLLDTLLEDKGAFRLAPSYGAGFALSKVQKWIVTVEIKYADWNRVTFLTRGQKVGSHFRVAVGGEWIPNLESSRYWQWIHFRGGFSYTQGPLEVNGERVKGYSLTAGIGFPFKKNFSMVNLGGELSQMGKNRSPLVLDKRVRFYFGVSFNELWFVKKLLE